MFYDDSNKHYAIFVNEDIDTRIVIGDIEIMSNIKYTSEFVHHVDVITAMVATLEESKN